jgi:PR domain zinc finger protein 4
VNYTPNLCLLNSLSAGCTLCDRAYPSDCPDHGPVTFVPDTPIESRARLSLPKQLVLRQSIVGAEVGKNLEP